MCNYVFEEPEQVIQNGYVYEENGVLYCASATQKGVYCYTYARNNPLMYTDPDGEFIWIPMLIGAVVAATSYTIKVAVSPGGFQNWDWGKFALNVGLGAFSGAATAGIGAAFGPIASAGIVGELGRAGMHALTQGTIALAGGGNFWQGAASGGLSSIAGSAFMMYGGNFANSTLGTYAFSAVAGGVGSKLTGGKFWEGTVTGLMNAGLNHLAQGLYSKYYLSFDGDKLHVIETKTGKTVYTTEATSGKGEHMNNPASQHLENLGPIPEGEYSYENSKWQTLSRLQQLNRLIKGSDWGAHNVPLDIINNNQPHRSDFFLHGGVFKGSSGCIDARRNVGHIYQLTKSQATTFLIIKY